MTKSQHAVNGLRNQSAILTIEQAVRIADAISNAPEVFPNPVPTAQQLKEAALKTGNSFNDAQGGSHLQRNKFKTDLENLKEMIRAMCNYVNCIANGDTNKILLSGFNLSKLPEPRPEPKAIKQMKVTYINNPGQVLASWSASKHHLFYLLQVSTDPTDGYSWKDVTTITARQHMVKNLASGKRHYFRVIACGSRGASKPSDIASVMVA